METELRDCDDDCCDVPDDNDCYNVDEYGCDCMMIVMMWMIMVVTLMRILLFLVRCYNADDNGGYDVDDDDCYSVDMNGCYEGDDSGYNVDNILCCGEEKKNSRGTKGFCCVKLFTVRLCTE
jgi:hypothetical protein